ncbi:hypothetical protein [Catenovulum sediminis]|uniref:Lipoprotein n=1 Tax=Catenovulum sediminis TaxID=1740262 RepID=A0ABV1RKX2_9ALTE
MRKLLILGCLIILSACATIEEETRIGSDLTAVQFNSIASSYLNRPTFVTLKKMSSGETVLGIEMDRYGSTKSTIHFLSNNVEIYINFINKYLEWANIARNRGDAITKDIGMVETWSNGSTANIKFEMHSGNSKDHYLVLTFCAVGACLDEYSMFFDNKNAIKLIKLLQQFKNGGLKPVDINEIYK